MNERTFDILLPFIQILVNEKQKSVMNIRVEQEKKVMPLNGFAIEEFKKKYRIC